MKSLRVFLVTIIVLVGAMIIAVPSVFAQESQSLTYDFDPYVVGRHQQDWVIVENFSSEQALNVVVRAIDPLTGDVLDEERILGILPGEGAKMWLTDTNRRAHLSRLKVEIRFDDASGVPVDVQGLDTDLNGEPLVRVTRLLLDRRLNTKLQVRGVPMTNGLSQ
jgi:hypothetical protein